MERRRRFEFDFRERDDERGYRRVRCGSGSMDDDRDSLPEWCLEDAEEEMGTFDSSGAFLSLKVKKEKKLSWVFYSPEANVLLCQVDYGCLFTS